MRKKNDSKKEKVKAYEGLKPWSLLFDLNEFTHDELIGPQMNNILLITWGQTMSQKRFKISHY
jgi:hypothetical protein